MIAVTEARLQALRRMVVWEMTEKGSDASFSVHSGFLLEIIDAALRARTILEGEGDAQ